MIDDICLCMSHLGKFQGITQMMGALRSLAAKVRRDYRDHSAEELQV